MSISGIGFFYLYGGNTINGQMTKEDIEKSKELIPTNCYAKFNQDCREWLVWGKHSGRYDRLTFQNFIESLLRNP
jgi:hypothetical protein